MGLVAAAGDVTAYGGPSSSWLTYVFTGIPGAVFLTVFCAGCLARLCYLSKQAKEVSLSCSPRVSTAVARHLFL